MQAVQIILGAFGNPGIYSHDDHASVTYRGIVNALCREYGVFALNEDGDLSGGRDFQRELFSFMLREKNVERVLDAVELSFKEVRCESLSLTHFSVPDPDNRFQHAIDEINARFQEAGFGYRFENDKIIRIDSEFVHTEIVKPALVLLQGQGFQGGGRRVFQGSRTLQARES